MKSEGPTHPGIANTDYVKRKIQEQAAQLIELQHTSRHITNVRTTIGIVVAAVSTAFGVFFALEARGQDRVDAGVGPLATDVRRVEQRTEKLETAVQGLALKGERTEVMVEMLVKNRGLTPPPPVVLDGGR